MEKYSVGDMAYILESGKFIREGRIMRISGGIYLFRFIEGGAIQIKEHRLYESEESAQKELDRIQRDIGTKKSIQYWEAGA